MIPAPLSYVPELAADKQKEDGHHGHRHGEG
jgi:hypothetical protein